MSGGDLTRRTVLAGGLATAGCSAVPALPKIETLARYSHGVDPSTQRAIITIPGTLGSRLRIGRDGPFIWGGPNRLSFDPENIDEARHIALPLGDGTQSFRELTDGVRTDGVLRRATARVLFAQVEEEVYDGLTQVLNAGGYQFSRTLAEEAERSGQNPGSLEFPYDWRRDIVEAAHVLDKFVERKARQVNRVRTKLYGTAEPADTMRFDFVAHSMGTLVLRYWLMYGTQDLPEDGSLPRLTWAGARRTNAAIFVAPPNLGSITALMSLTEGRQFGFLQPVYPPALLSTFVTNYQLLPRDRHNRALTSNGQQVGSLFDVETWSRLGWGLLDPGQADLLSVLMPDAPSGAARRAIAERYTDRALRRAVQFHRAMDRGGAPPVGTDFYLVVGTGLDTRASVEVDPATGALEDGEAEEGDGVVLRASALMDERQGGNQPTRRGRPIQYRTTLLLPAEHVNLTNSPVFADNLLYWLNDSPRTRDATALPTIKAPSIPLIR